MKKILILNHHGIGDVLMNIPLVKTLNKKKFKIFMTFKGELEKSLINHTGVINDSFLYDFRRTKFPKNISHFISFIYNLKKHSFDVGFSTCGTNTFYSKLLFNFLGIKNRIYVGENIGNNEHKSKINLDHLSSIDIHEKDLIKDFMIQIPSNKKIDLIINSEEKICCLHPGSGPKEKQKRLGLHTFEKIFELLPDFKFLITGSSVEENICSKLFDLGTKKGVDIHNLCNKYNISETAYILKNSSFVIGGDSGILHLANSVGTPCLGFFGPTNPLHTGPYGKKNIFILSKNCHCIYPNIKENCDCMRDFSITEIKSGLDRLTN